MEMLLTNNDANQTYSILFANNELQGMASSPPSASTVAATSSAVATIGSSVYHPTTAGGGDTEIPWHWDASPSSQALLLNSDWFQQNNMSQILLNMSAENLTNLITAIQREHIVPPERAPMPLLATLTVCYSLIFLAGVLGNLITCIVISRNKIMHTATNFYLFNLAVSDLILLISGKFIKITE